jgi:molybdenum cofactor biosynthesis enzyme MoaA
MRRWITNMAEIEIEITSFCNLACYNCNRSVRQAPTNECMSLSQVERFVSESLVMKRG